MDFDPDSFISGGQPAAEAPSSASAQPLPSSAPSQPQVDSNGFDPDSFIQDSLQDQYGGIGQQAVAGLEGAAQGVAGPLAPAAERMLGVKPEDIRGRAEANPFTHGLGEAAGLTGGMLTGTGEAAVMGKAGELAAQAVGLGEVAKDATYGFKVGSAAVKQAAEMAVLQSSDEATKMVIQDPNASAQSAIANIGLSAAFGGATGGFMSGVVNPLWEATAGPKVTEFLSGFRNHLNGEPLKLPTERAQALETLGIEVSPATRAALSGDPKAMQFFNELRESQHPEILNDIKNLSKSSSDSVLQSLGVAPETVADYSENTAGHKLFDVFEDEYKQKYEPIAKQLEERNAVASTISVPDEARMAKYGQMIEKGMETYGATDEVGQLYQKWGNKLLEKETIGGIDQIKTQLGNDLKFAYRQGDGNRIQALTEIKSMLHEFQETQILKQASQLEKEGAEYGKALGKDLINTRADVNRAYAEFAKMSNDLSGHLGVGEFRGFGAMNKKLGDGVSAEQLLKKFSPKNNADIISFLQQHFPQTLEAVRQNEVAQLLKPAVLGAKGEEAIDMNRLSKTIKNGLAGKADYVKWALPEQALNKIQAADTIQNALPSFKSSGTAGWLMKLTKHMPMSAMAGVGYMMGHNPITGALIGELSERMGVHAPNAVKMGMLKFMGSEAPISSTGFKGMVDFLHNTAKGENMLAKSTAAIFKSGVQVLTSSQMPAQADREKLDKIVDRMSENPHQLMALSNGHVGHYMPEHQTAIAQAGSQAVHYLASIKPKPTQSSPLGETIEPSKAAQARYNRALDIAQQPAVILDHIKKGTLQASDVADLKAMYPALYSRFASRMTGLIAERKASDEIIPYKTRIAASMFLGQPLDSSMTPQGIQAAQAFQASQTPLQTPQVQAKGRPSAMKEKGAKAYMTAGQAAESDRSNRD